MKVSVVIPVHDEEESLPPLMERLEAALGTLGCETEVIYVDDGSRDRSLEILASFAARRGVRVVELARNCGQHPALFAGFSVATGDVVVTLDGDLQNPPEEIPRLVRTLVDGGYDVVGSVRQERKDSPLRTVPSRIVNFAARRMTGVALSDWGCMLRAYRREVVEAMVAGGEYATFIPALATLYAKRVTEIPVAHEERHGGSSSYGPRKLLSLLFDLLTSFSDFPLRILLYLGAALALGSAAFGAALAAARLRYGPEWGAYGLFSLFAVLFFLVGGLFLGMGITGQYVGRIYHEVRRRPPYTIRRVHGG